MKPAYADRLAAIQAALADLIADARADRNAATGGAKTALRRFGNRLDRADEQLRFAAKETTK